MKASASAPLALLLLLLSLPACARTPAPAPTPAAGVDCDPARLPQRAELEEAAPLGRQPKPAFLTAQGLPRSGRAVLRFAVDTTGQVMPESVQILEATHPAFGEAARATLLGWRYRPAYLQASGCKVKQRMERTFNFLR